MRLNLKVWRQAGRESAGRLASYVLDDVSPDSSFLEMLDLLNEQLIARSEEPVAFDHDCREGICGMCSLVINGVAHGPERATTTCQLHMRHFMDGEEITIEPFRAGPFVVLRDLVVDRSPFDLIIQAGGFITCRTGSAPDANEIPVPKAIAEESMDAASCIGCGACVAACPNASAMLFTAAKISHLNLLPQGWAEKKRRSLAMVAAMDEAGFGNCSNHGECEAACPKEISLDHIARMNRNYTSAKIQSWFRR
jgi:succinate dehydrogenase / fumarate reductase iron-sulfur subunit